MNIFDSLFFGSFGVVGDASAMSEAQLQQRDFAMARLQQLNWLALNGDSKQIKSEARKEYEKLKRETETFFLQKSAP